MKIRTSDLRTNTTSHTALACVRVSAEKLPPAGDQATAHVGRNPETRSASPQIYEAQAAKKPPTIGISMAAEDEGNDVVEGDPGHDPRPMASTLKVAPPPKL